MRRKKEQIRSQEKLEEGHAKQFRMRPKKGTQESSKNSEKELKKTERKKVGKQ